MIKIILQVVLIPFRIIAMLIRAVFILFKPNSSHRFNRETNLWGLSNEDKRIAKEERMSDADYIEAEERDDDNLDDDD